MAPTCAGSDQVKPGEGEGPVTRDSSADVESIVDTGAPVCCKTRSQVTIWCVPLYVLSSGQGSPTLGVYFLFLISRVLCVSEMTLEFSL